MANKYSTVKVVFLVKMVKQFGGVPIHVNYIICVLVT